MANRIEKKRGDWNTEEEIRIIELRDMGKGWKDISSQLPGRSLVARSRHYHQYLTGKTLRPRLYRLCLTKMNKPSPKFNPNLPPMSSRSQNIIERLPGIREIFR